MNFILNELTLTRATTASLYISSNFDANKSISLETKFSPQNVHLIAMAGNSNHSSFGTRKS